MSEHSLDNIGFADNYKKVDWSRAACEGISFNAFYTQDDERGTVLKSRTFYARTICAVCPIQRECLKYAFQHEKYGMWGAVTAAERYFLITGKLGGPTVREGLAELADMGISLFSVRQTLKEARSNEH